MTEKKQDFRIGAPQVGSPAMTVHPSPPKQPEKADAKTDEQRKEGNDKPQGDNAS